MLSKFTNILLAGVVLVFALATPSRAQTAPAMQDPSPSVSTTLTPPSVLIGESSTVAVNFNNVPDGGFASAEFICTYNPAMVEISAITPTDLFGHDPITAVNGPQNGSFVFAIAGSIGHKAMSDGAVFTFSAKGLQVGQQAIDCQARASVGNLTLVAMPSTPASLDVTENVPTPTQGTFAGQVFAGKPVTITLKDQAGSVVGAVVVNPDGTFSLSVPAGTYTAVASAPGFLRAQGTVSIAGGGTTTIQAVNLLAGDIDGNDVIDHFDVLTIGINYNGTEPAVADLSNDGTINVLELEILSPNYRQVGPLSITVVGSPPVTNSPPPNPTNTGVPVVTATATQAPPTAVPPTVTPMPNGASLILWHAPGAHDELNPHEHGDTPPAWADEWSMKNFDHPVIFGGDESTGDMERFHKHQAFKGVSTTFTARNGCSIDLYFRYHAASNPMDRAFAFHSYEMYAKDCQDGISFWQGWYWVGYPEFRSQRMTKANEQPGSILSDGSGQPAPSRDQFIISAPDQNDWNNFLRSDQWYAFNPFWEVSITILNSTTFFSYDEYLTDYHDQSTWKLTGDKGLGRRFEFSHYTTTSAGSPVDGVQVPLDSWYCVQLQPTEDKVEGPTHRPHWNVTGAVSGPSACPDGYLPHYKASTFPAAGLSFRDGNTFTKTFPGFAIVTIPN